MQRGYARVAVTGDEEHGGGLHSPLYIVIRRIGIDVFELRGVFRRAIFWNPVRRFHKFVVTHHVEKRIFADDGLYQIGPLSKSCADKKSAVASAFNSQFF